MAYARTTRPRWPGQRPTRMTSGAPSYGGRPGRTPSGAAMPGEAMGADNVSRSASRGAGPAETHSLLAAEARSFANELLPELRRGLRATRSRFGGGAIRSGGAQQAEELAHMRLFTNPLNDRIAQLGRFSAELGFRRQQHADSYGLARDQHNLDRDRYEEDIRRFDVQQRTQRRQGIGRLVGTVAGGVGGFFLGGPAGALAGASAVGGALGGS